MGRQRDYQEAEYICGRCNETVYYLVYETPPPCPECGWIFKERKQTDVPDARLPLSK